MAKFKTGDKVIRKRGLDFGIVKLNGVYTVSEIDVNSLKEIKIKGDDTNSYEPDFFDLVFSSLPTDRPLTYDETQRLKKGDVVKSFGHSFVVKSVDKEAIRYEKNTYAYTGYALNSFEEKTGDNIYFVSHGKEESKEEKKEEVKYFDKVIFDDIPTHKGNVWTTSTITGYDCAMGIARDSKGKQITAEKLREAKLLKENGIKSVSQILYGR